MNKTSANKTTSAKRPKRLTLRQIFEKLDPQGTGMIRGTFTLSRRAWKSMKFEAFIEDPQQKIVEIKQISEEHFGLPLVSES